MEVFLTVAGVVGFVSATNGIIGLCERALSLLDHVRHTKDLVVERVRVVNILAVYLKLKEKLELGEEAMGGFDLESLRQSTLVVQDRLTQILPKLQPSVVISQKKSIKTKLDEIFLVLDSYMFLWHFEGRSGPSNQTPTDTVAQLLKDNKLLQRLMNPDNCRLFARSSLRGQDWYTETLEVELNNARRVLLEDKAYMVEKIALGKTPKETERRLSRLGKLLVIMRENEEEGICSLLRMSKIVKGPESFFILSELEDTRYVVLEEMLPHLNNDQGLKVLLRIAEAVQSLHKLSLVHEGLSSYNILVHRESMEIKLTGFASAREILDLSDCLTPDEPDLRKRNQIFQAPERLAGSRYSFECDVYSLGVVMAEVCHGRLLMQKPKTSKDDIMKLFGQPSPVFGEIETQIIALIQDILMTQIASKRPLALEITERLSRMCPN